MLFLFLNDISTGEVLIILVFILMFFGSKSIPNMARTFGRTLRQIRDATDDIKRDIRNSTSGIEKEITDARDKFSENAKSVSDGFSQQTKSLEDITKKFKNTLEESGKETLSNKRKPITQKFVEEDDLIVESVEDNAQPEVENKKIEIPKQPEGEVVANEHSNNSYAEDVARNRNKAKADEADVTPDSKSADPKPDNHSETDKAPES
jgi:sec-independent protein translocase protein TatA